MDRREQVTMIWLRIAVFAFLIMVGLVAVSAEAQTYCKAHEVLSSELKDKHGEVLFMQGSVNLRPMIVQIYVNQETGQWTAVATNTNTNLSCVASHGTNFETIPFKRKEHKHGA